MELGPFPGGFVVVCISRTYIIQMYLSISAKSKIKGGWNGSTISYLLHVLAYLFLSSVSARSCINIRKMKKTQRCWCQRCQPCRTRPSTWRTVWVQRPGSNWTCFLHWATPRGSWKLHKVCSFPQSRTFLVVVPVSCWGESDNNQWQRPVVNLTFCILTIIDLAIQMIKNQVPSPFT